MTTPSSEVFPSTLPTLERRGPLALVREGVEELISRQRLIRYMLGANLKRTHNDTLLGNLWWVVDPLLQMAIYFILVDIIFRRDTPDYPLFIFAAILPWKWFSTSVSSASVSVTGREGLLRQIPFPKIVLPVSAVFAGTISFGFGLIALALVYVFFLDRITPWLLALPLIAAVQLVFTLAVGTVLAAVNAFYRDVQNVLGHVLRLWFYLSPGLYSLDHIAHHQNVRFLLGLNPMAPILESYRHVIYGTETQAGAPPDFLGLAWVLVFSAVAFGVAIAIFKRVEPAFARII